MCIHRKMSFVILVVLMIRVNCLQGYEDNTHQRLSERAIQIAAINASDVPDELVALFVDVQGNIQPLGIQIINGAGAGPAARGEKEPNKFDGEDYTDYEVIENDKGCPRTIKENRGQAMLYAISGKTVPLSFPRDVT